MWHNHEPKSLSRKVKGTELYRLFRLFYSKHTTLVAYYIKDPLKKEKEGKK